MAKKKDKGGIQLRALIEIGLKHWWWFAVSVFVCCCLAFLYSRSHEPVFSVKSSVIVRPDNTKNITSMSGLGSIFGNNADANDEVFVIKSHTVMRAVVKELGINESHYVKAGLLRTHFAWPDYPIKVTPAADYADTLRTGLAFKIKVGKDMKANVEVKARNKKIAEAEDVKLPVAISTAYGKFVVDTTGFFPKKPKRAVKTTIYYSGYDVVAEDLAKSIKSEKPDKYSSMINLSLTTPNLEYGKAVLDAVMSNYNAVGIEQSNQQARQTLAFINGRLEMISGDLSDAEHSIQNYKQGNRIVDVSIEAQYNQTLRSSAERALIQQETENEITRMTRDFLSQPQNEHSLIPMSGDVPAVNAGIQQYNSLIIRRMDLAQNERANKSLIKNVDEQLTATRESLIASLDRTLQAQQVTIRETRAEANRALGRLGNVPEQEREYLNLKRNQEVKQQLYLFLLQRREETAMAMANAVPKGRIIEQAYSLSKPLGLGFLKLMFLAFIFGMLIPVGILYLKSMLRNKFESRKDFESLTDVPVLGEVCIDNSGRKLVVSGQNTTSTVELFRLIRTSLQFMLHDAGDKVVIVTSTRSGEGKSFISVNLAASLALLGKKVLLIGMDIRKPQLAAYLNIANNKGVTNYLAHSVDNINDVITHDHEIKNLDVITAGPIPPNPGELLASSAVDDMFKTLREEYDYIIVDSAPVGMVSDTFNLARISDATIYVTRVNYTTLADVDFMNSIYANKRMPKLSTVVNGTKTNSGYGYGYGSQHSHLK